MTATATWLAQMTTERDAALAVVHSNLAQEDAPLSPNAIHRLALAQARLDAITAAAE